MGKQRKVGWFILYMSAKYPPAHKIKFLALPMLSFATNDAQS